MSLQYVIMSQPRCGTHLLQNCLRQHSQVDCIPELFNRHHQTICTLKATDAEGRLAEMDALPTPCLGFQNHDEFLHTGVPAGSHDAIFNFRPKLLLLWLSRRDKIAQYVSMKVAEMTGQWQLLDGEKAAPHPSGVVVEPSLFIEWHREQLQIRVQLLEKFHDWPSLELVYEDFEDNAQGVTSVILQALGLSSVPIVPSSRKQRNYVSLQKYILNYQQLVTACLEEDIIFRRTPRYL